jgi:hypothetical protein
MCDSNDLLIAYVYDELDGPGRRGFEDHLTSCADCRSELAGLRSTRFHLASWAPPEPDFAFHIVRGPAAPISPPAPRFRFTPAWGLAAAAVLLLAVGAAIANIEVRYGTEGLVLRTGWSRQAAPVVAEVSRGSNGVVPVDVKQRVDAFEARLRQLETPAPGQAIAASTAQPAAVSDAEILRRVRDLLAQSETRQQRALAARIEQLSRDVDARRKVDLTAIDQGMMRLQNTSRAEVQVYRDLTQRTIRAIAYQPK